MTTDETTSSHESEQLTHSFRFDKFKVRGATHLETEVTIDRSGRWTSSSKVLTRDIRFKPRVTLFIEFFKDDNASIPNSVGEPPLDWQPKELWQEDFNRSEEKVVKSTGQSDYLAQHFDQLANASQGRLKMRLKKRPGLMDKFR